MTRPAEGPGTPLEPPGDRRPRWMAIHDRIRLTGLLRKPLQMQGLLFVRTSPVHHAPQVTAAIHVNASPVATARLRRDEDPEPTTRCLVH